MNTLARRLAEDEGFRLLLFDCRRRRLELGLQGTPRLRVHGCGGTMSLCSDEDDDAAGLGGSSVLGGVMGSTSRGALGLSSG